MKTYYVKHVDQDQPEIVKAYNALWAASTYHQNSDKANQNAIVLVWSAKQWQAQELPTDYYAYGSG